jgi:hypothetical protein
MLITFQEDDPSASEAVTDVRYSDDSSEDESGECSRRLQHAIEGDDVLASFYMPEPSESAVDDDSASTSSENTLHNCGDEEVGDDDVIIHDDVDVDVLVELEAQSSRPLRFPVTPSPGPGDPRFLHACRSCLLSDNPLLPDPRGNAKGGFS